MVSPIGVCAEQCTGYESLHVHVYKHAGPN